MEKRKNMKHNKTIAWLWSVAGSRKVYIIALTLVQGISGVMGVLYALLFRAIVDSAVGKDYSSFRHNVILIICLVLVQLAIAAIIRWLRELASADIENVFKQRLLDNILHKDYASVSATHTAEWLNRLTSDTTVIAGGAVDILPGFTGTVVRMVSALIMIIALDRWFAFILIPGGFALIFLTYAFRGVLKRLHKGIQESDGRLRVFLQERISSLIIIKAFSAEAQTCEGASRAMADHKAARMRRNHFSNVANIGFGAAMQGMNLIGVVYCAYGIMTGRVTYGTLTAIMQLISQVQGPFANISAYLPRWYAMTASAERLMEAEAYADDREPMEKRTAAVLYKRMDSIGLRNASFTYKSGEAPTVLNNLSLEIRRGEYVAFTGQSGCGKSTVLKLLMCMYPLDRGDRYLSIRDDLGSVSFIPLSPVHRRLFAYVPQGNVLMNGSIRDVVCFAEKQDESRLKKALTIACADRFLNDLNTMLGERGSGLSEGQMQRLAIARAVYSDAPVLLLDESTSALDAATERQVLENLKNMTDKTVIIVTHRKAALAICDRVLKFTKSGVQDA